MSDIVRSRDGEKDRESWMRRVAAMLARELVETVFEGQQTENQHDERSTQVTGDS